LLDGPVRRLASRPGECVWGPGEGSDRGHRVIVRVWAERPNGDHSGPAMAARRFAGERASRAGAEGKVFRKVTGGVTDLTGVGEAAFAQHSFEVFPGPDQGRMDGVVLLRVSNLLGEVVVHRREVPVKAVARERERAISAARVVSAALKP
ncbi:hypothetical protein, partial [Nonomuraea lactucae]|uniref:hypothetical protein n=1 Tax=Nonomuraea lactucae TaxID=2249762 RepID=UPI0013B3F196